VVVSVLTEREWTQMRRCVLLKAVITDSAAPLLPFSNVSAMRVWQYSQARMIVMLLDIILRLSLLQFAAARSAVVFVLDDGAVGPDLLRLARPCV
jgi:hypothetical protein